MNLAALAAFLGPFAVMAGAWVSYQLGKRRSNVDIREVAVAERHATVEEVQLGAAMRDELRSVNIVLTQQVAALTTDNGLLHKRMHDFANSQMEIQSQMVELADDRDQCRRDLAEVLLAVNALEQGRARMATRLDQLEGSADA